MSASESGSFYSEIHLVICGSKSPFRFVKFHLARKLYVLTLELQMTW